PGRSRAVWEQRVERREALFERHGPIGVLTQKLLQPGPAVDRLVYARIAAPRVGADRDEVAVLRVDGVQPAEAAREREMARRRDRLHRAADRGLDVDRGVEAGLGERPRQHDVPV